ncbi:MAG: hypothetical protein NTW93_02445 [Phycisphaerae bacterium]|nr:hypothetical protein [Phycisphaerae bacterium]
MGRTKSNLVELFIDKVILAAALIISLGILLVFVIRSPNTIKYDGKKFAPGQIDEYINRKAGTLSEQLKQEPQDNNSYEPKVTLYLGLIKDSLKNVDTNIDFPLPDSPPVTVDVENRTYQLPKIELAGKASVADVTMAAYVPTEELSDTLTYGNAETKPADVDLVTVESGINAKQLYESFNSALAGKNIPDEWKIEQQYAKPIFAKVELQRRTLLEDGSWSQWTEVPKTKICHLKNILQLPAQTNEYETQIALVQFAKIEIRNEVLQPPVYDNAIPGEKWFCPSLYKERQKKLEKEKEEFKKQQMEADKAKKLQEKASRVRQPAARQATSQPRATGGGGGEDGGGGGSMPQAQPRQNRPVAVQQTPSRQPQQRTRPTAPEGQKGQTEEQQFNEMLLSEKTNTDTLEKLVFWAHDDTTKPGEKYQYRIRIGVLNPIAGKPWFSPEQKDLQNQMVLFSNFSEPTETIEIPNKLHFFATDIKETEKGGIVDKTVEVKVARYTLGNWVSETFSVKPGEQIGTVSNNEKVKARLVQAGIEAGPIDLITGNIMVDARRITEWTGTALLKSKEFYELLYCRPGQAIQTMPVKERYWSEEVSKIYKEIKDAESAEPVVLLSRSDAASDVSTTRTRGTPGTPGEFEGSNQGMPPQGMPAGPGAPVNREE